MAEQGNRVSIQYKLSLDDGTPVEDNVDGEALVYVHGDEEILPALEERLSSLAEGEEAKVVLPPADAYGPVLDEAFQEFELDVVPEEARHVGAVLDAEGEDGSHHRLVVHEVNDDKIILDFNHPLAGKTLVFEVKVLSIES